MEHKKYNSIENSYREKFIGEIIKHELNGGVWYVENKLHGSNISFYITQSEIRVAKKTTFLDENENFHNHGKLLNRHQQDFRELFQFFVDDRKAGEVVVYGEIFGGNYPHPDVEKVKGVSRVQKGIYYSPDIQFHAFDIMVDGEFLPCVEKYEVFKTMGIPYCEPLFSGTLNECLNYNEVFLDPTYKKFGLPEIENNYSEGIVIKPNEARFLPSGSRVILKKKNSKYKEVEKKTSSKNKEEVNLPENVLIHWNKISEYITENRLRNVISHIGQITQRDFGTLLKKFNEDILTDYEKDYDLSNLEKGDQKLLTGKLNNISSKLIRSNFLNIIDGVF